LDTYWNE
jgi:hypothetical protein